MKKKVVIITILIIVVFSLSGIISACKPGVTQIDRIDVVTGGLKEFYALDEQMNFSDAKIKVYYTDGSSLIVLVNPEMLEGFDTSTTKENASMKITYENHSVTFTYSVTNSVPVQTPFRIQLVKKEEDGRDVTLNVRAVALEKSGPVYAVMLTLQSSSDSKINSVTLKQDGFSKTETWSGNTLVSIVIFSNDGISAISEDSIILEVSTTRNAKTGSINCQSISISDGEEDYSVPPATALDIGETES